MEFQTIYFNADFDVNSIDVRTLEELFGVEISLGVGQYINVYTNDSSVVDSIADELKHENIAEIARR